MVSSGDHPRPVLVAEQKFHPGNPVTVVGASPCTAFQAVFEDEGDTGYFYGLDTRASAQPILDARHIYNVKDVVDRSKTSVVQIVWSSDGLRVALFINDHAHAAFDFVARRGYCRTGFPPPHGDFSVEGHAWSDDVLRFFE